MKYHTFSMTASVTVWAETEEEAREMLRHSCLSQDEDVYYGYKEIVGVYLPLQNAEKAVLQEVHGETDDFDQLMQEIDHE